jgi:ELWxxDGT repeat protein
VATGPADSYPTELVPLGGGRLVFTAETSSTGREVWMVDASTGSLQLLRDIHPGSAGSAPRDLTRVGVRRVFFSAEDPANGRELWVTDGTPAGTRLIADVQAFSGSSRPTRVAAVRGRLLFGADDGVHGAELFALDVGAMTLAVGAGTGEGSLAPTLRGADALLGGLMPIEGTDPGTATAAFLLFGTPVPEYPAIGHQFALLAPTVASVTAVQRGAFSFGFPVPYLPAIAGATIGMQVVTVPSTAPGGGSTTNGLHVTFGF